MFVLIHGGGHSARCWEAVVPLLDGPAVALDLPGRGAHPMPLDRVRLAAWMRVAAADIDALGRDDIVLVGHSMAGLAIAGVIDLVHSRLRHVALVSCVVPPHGQSLLDMLPPEIRAIAEAAEPTPEGVALDEASIRAMQCADMSEEQAAFTVSVVVPELIGRSVNRSTSPVFERLVPLTWIELRDDQTFPPEMQQEMARRAKSTTTVPLASGHVAMISHPEDSPRP